MKATLLGWYHHLAEGIFSCVRELACTSELKSYAGGSLAAGSATQARQVLREVLDRETLRPSKLGGGYRPDILTCKNSIVLKPQQWKGHGPKHAEASWKKTLRREKRMPLIFDNSAVIPWSPHCYAVCVKWNIFAQKCKNHFHELKLLHVTAERRNTFCFLPRKMFQKLDKYVRFEVTTVPILRILDFWDVMLRTRRHKNPWLQIYYEGFILSARNIFLITISSPRYLQPKEALPT